MKTHFIIILITALAITSCAPPKLIQIQPVQKSFQASGDRADLYVKANNWMVENFTNAKSVIQFSDKEEGIVTGKYFLRDALTKGGAANSVFAIIKIEVKDGAGRITITADDFYGSNSAIWHEDYRYENGMAEAQINELIDSFEAYLKRPADSW